MNWNLPNILTFLRLLAAPGVAVMFLYFARPISDWYALLLFLGAAITDFFDGYLARRWKQESRFGAMLDPIADKAMVMMRPPLAPQPRSWKKSYIWRASFSLIPSTAQMIALAVLFSEGLFEHSFGIRTMGMDSQMILDILTGREEDHLGLVWKYNAMIWSWWIGIVLLWIAATLTLLTGFDYFRKALPLLRDEE